MDSTPNGLHPEGTPPLRDSTPKGLNPEMTQSRVGLNPKRTPSRLGLNPEWIQPRKGLNLEFLSTSNGTISPFKYRILLFSFIMNQGLYQKNEFKKRIQYSSI